MKQPDAKIRELDREEPLDGERQEVYCTKVGASHPNEMYIVSGHMDGHGVNQGSNDDASGTALVMELARIFSAATSGRIARSASFCGTTKRPVIKAPLPMSSSAGRCRESRDPAASGRYPEPRWLGMIQHDMMLFDHGAPGPDGTCESRLNGARPT